MDSPVSSILDPLRIGGKYFRAGGGVSLIRGVTFGPFPAGAFPDEGRGQLRRIRERLGANAIRVFEIPSPDFMHACAEVGLRVFITLPWEQHIDFLTERGALARADHLLLETLLRFRGHPALAGYFVGNAIRADLVGWMGASRVLEQLERLIDLGRANDPGALFAYANRPGTEFLLPQNQDFTAFHLGAVSKETLASRLLHLQNLAGEKPLFLSGFGADAGIRGELRQAEVLDGFLEAATSTGIAGLEISTWCDLRRGEESAEAGRDFGLVRSDFSERAAVEVVRESWGLWRHPGNGVVLTRTPRVSLVVCARGASETLVASLDSFAALEYPDLEILLVNEGGDPRVEEIARTYPAIRHLFPEGRGLASARNTGAAAATGEIFVFSDTDCLVEKDWLKWVVRLFNEDDPPGGAGGPVVSAKADSATRARIAAAPGGLPHRLFSNTEAAYLSSSNLAVRREVFERIGGFNPFFLSAGDDRDFSRRVLVSGSRLGFHPAAFVQRHREATYPAYLKSQIEYGRAEALLLAIRRQSSREDPGEAAPDFPGLALHFLWWMAVLVLGLAAIRFPNLLYPFVLMILGSLWSAVVRAGRAEIDPEFDSTASRIVLVGLILARGVLRSGARILSGWRHLDWAEEFRFIGKAAFHRAASDWWKLGDEKEYWSSGGIGRPEFLEAIRQRFEGSEEDPCGKSDLVIAKGMFWNYAVLILTEDREDNRKLTRLRLLARPQWVTKMIVLPLLILVPVIVVFGLGPGGELLTLALLYGIVSVAAKAFLWIRRPRFNRIARSIGLDPA